MVEFFNDQSLCVVKIMGDSIIFVFDYIIFILPIPNSIYVKILLNDILEFKKLKKCNSTSIKSLQVIQSGIFKHMNIIKFKLLISPQKRLNKF